eukprot:6214632-Prymnesium_polylepis.1
MQEGVDDGTCRHRHARPLRSAGLRVQHRPRFACRRRVTREALIELSEQQVERAAEAKVASDGEGGDGRRAVAAHAHLQHRQAHRVHAHEAGGERDAPTRWLGPRHATEPPDGARVAAQTARGGRRRRLAEPAQRRRQHHAARRERREEEEAARAGRLEQLAGEQRGRRAERAERAPAERL